jgi:hypothetical protein
MQLDKQTILNLIREHGNAEHVDTADRQLPDHVDTNEHQDLLAQFGLTTDTLKSHLQGGLGSL